MGVRTLVIGCCLLVAACTSSGTAGDPTAPATATSTTRAPSPAPPSSSATPAGPADWPAYHGDEARSGVSRDMPAVRGPLHTVATLRLDGAVYASPIVADGVVVVATENDTVYGFDPTTYRQVWKRHLGSPSPSAERDCGNIDPLGITGTPVYDAGTGLVYVAPQYGGPPRHELVALQLRTGAVRWRATLDLPGVETKAMQERGALAISGGRVWVPFGGLAGDCGGYKGRVIGYPLRGGTPVAYTVPTTREAGIWTPPGPVVAPDGTLFVAVGNGESGTGDPYDHSDSILAIGTDGRLRDSFSPTTWATDNEGDLDLGSQGPALVGPWVFSAGKSGTAYVLRRDRLGGIGGQVSRADVCRSFGGTAVQGDVVYVPCTDGVQAVRIDAAGRIHHLWTAGVAGSPVLGGGRVWTLDASAGVLHALDPGSGRAREQIRVGETSRFATPALYGSQVLVPTLAGLTVIAAR